jgi:hypothetical protein
MKTASVPLAESVRAACPEPTPPGYIRALRFFERLAKADAIALIFWTAGIICGGIWVAVCLTVPKLVPILVARFL